MQFLHRLDAALMRAPGPVRALVLAGTLLVMIVTALPHVPRTALDFSRVPMLQSVQQPGNFGPDTIADMYEARVVLNDPSDMYVKAGVDQTPLEAATWSKAASAPYPPAMLLVEAGLAAIGESAGIGLYGMVLLLAIAFLGLSLAYFVKTRWYLFPVLYVNFAYFGYRFVYVQDGSYLVMLVVVIGALWLARANRDVCHPLMALAIVMKISPLYYVRHVLTMRRPVAMLFVGILLAGLVLPIFLLDNYLSIYRFASENKGHWSGAVGALLLAVPFALALWYVEERLSFDLEDRIGWSLVPLAMLLAIKMNVPRHLLIVLLVPDKRGVRNLAAAIGLGGYALFPSLLRFGAVGPIAVTLLAGVLVYYLSQVGWPVVRDDIRHPARTVRWLLAGNRLAARNISR